VLLRCEDNLVHGPVVVRLARLHVHRGLILASDELKVERRRALVLVDASREPVARLDVVPEDTVDRCAVS